MDKDLVILKYLKRKLQQKPLSFFIGWIGVLVIVLNNQFFQGRFLYSQELSFLTSDISGVLFFLFWIMLAVEIVNFDFGKSKNEKNWD